MLEYSISGFRIKRNANLRAPLASERDAERGGGVYDRWAPNGSEIRGKEEEIRAEQEAPSTVAGGDEASEGSGGGQSQGEKWVPGSEVVLRVVATRGKVTDRGSGARAATTAQGTAHRRRRR